ncbi:MAG: type II toxin-antitoxin system PemK/MazF family toxin [Clostridia bacterium]|nr:type II toxin-antitoxin system PemK/MazF family toxin [Clostridia bacterium]
MKRKYKRGEIYYADLSPVVGSEQGGYRTVLVLQNNKGNKYSSTVIVASITSRLGKHKLPTHVDMSSIRLKKHSIALLEQLRTIDKSRMKEYIGKATKAEMTEIETALLISVGIQQEFLMNPKLVMFMLSVIRKYFDRVLDIYPII